MNSVLKMMNLVLKMMNYVLKTMNFALKWAALMLKDDGNEAFKSGDNITAVRLYTEAIAEEPLNHALYCNRSAALRSL